MSLRAQARSNRNRYDIIPMLPDLISIPDRDNSGRTPTKETGFFAVFAIRNTSSRKNPVSDHGCVSPRDLGYFNPDKDLG